MSDLQCAARLVVLNPPGLVDPARVADGLADLKLAALYHSDDDVCRGLAVLLGERLGLIAETVRDDDLGDTTMGFEQVSDRHRGETVVVVRAGRSSVPLLLLVDSDDVVTRSVT